MASNLALQTVNRRGWLQGYGSLINKEHRRWWKTRQWLLHLIIWIVLCNGLLAMVLFVAPDTDETRQAARESAQSAQSPQQATEDLSKGELGLTLFFAVATLASSIGVVIVGQDAIITEKQMGTAAWMLSKPVSRSAFILSKVAANALGILVTMVLVPGALAYLLLSAATGPLPLDGFIAGLGMVYLTLLFYLTMTLMLGTLFNSRGAVVGIPMILMLGYQAFLGLAPWLAGIMPWNLTMQLGAQYPALAISLSQGQGITAPLPIVATMLWCVLFTAAAVWRFSREEF